MELRFNDPDEFLAELRLAPPNAEPLVRLTVRRRLDAQTGAIHHVSVVATYLRVLRAASGPLALVVVLEAYQGEDWGESFDCSGKTRQRAEQLLDRLRSIAGDLGLECAPGAYGLPPAQDSK
jgi:hypothetical protein